MSPLFSVVMPLWNKEREVARAIASVLSQTVADLELIVVNDGSTDASRAAVAAFSGDARVNLLDQQNAGVSAARNAGIVISSAEFVAFLDADDEWLPRFFERIAGLIRSHPDASVFATGILVGSADGAHARVSGVGPRFRGNVPDYFRTRGLLTSSSTVVRRSAFQVAGLFRDGVAFGEDLDMWLRLASRFPVAFDAEPQAIWHVDATNRACDSPARSCLGVLLDTLQHVERETSIRPSVKESVRTYVRDVGLEEIARLLARGDVDVARTTSRLWRTAFTPTASYLGLEFAASLPPTVLRSVGRAGARARRLMRSRSRRCEDREPPA